MTLSGGISCALLSASPLFVFMSGISSLVHSYQFDRFKHPDKHVANTLEHIGDSQSGGFSPKHTRKKSLKSQTIKTQTVFEVTCLPSVGGLEDVKKHAQEEILMTAIQ